MVTTRSSKRKVEDGSVEIPVAKKLKIGSKGQRGNGSKKNRIAASTSTPPTKKAGRNAVAAGSESLDNLLTSQAQAGNSGSLGPVISPGLNEVGSPELADVQQPEVTELIRCLQNFGQDIFELAQGLKLCPLDNISPRVKDMYESTTAAWPRAFKSEECWKMGRIPDYQSLLLATLDTIDAHKKSANKDICPAYSRGERDLSIDPRLAVVQLSDPRKVNPVALIGFKMPLEVVSADELKAPEALSKVVEPFYEENLQIFLTPKYWTTDLHIDHLDGISTVIGSCVKLWLIFPPTSVNLALMGEADGQKAKFHRISERMEGGVIYKMTSADALYVPVGTIHIVFTIQGGFLFTIDFTTSISAKPMLKLITSGMDELKNKQDKLFDQKKFLVALEISLWNNKVESALRTWIEALVHLKHELADNSILGKQVTKIWEDFFAERTAKGINCSCDSFQEGESLEKHFWEEHFWVRSPKRRSTRGTQEDSKAEVVTPK